MSIIEIKYYDNLNWHNDLVLRLGSGFKIICDSYWYHELPGMPEFTAKELVLLNLINLRDSLKEIKLNEYLYFPFDLSDQSSGFVCFRCLSLKGLINLYFVSSISFKGSEINPLFDPKFKLEFKDYFSIEGGFNCSLNDLVSDLGIIISEF